MEKIKVIVIGAGCRGMGYTNIMAEYPDKFEVVGVAEPLESRREYVKNKHNIPDEHCFTTWEDILKLPKFADVAIISTMDRMHFGPAVQAIRKGYNLLLEKPVAHTPQECVTIAQEAKKAGVKILVCHVLRYNSFFRALKEIIDSGEIGRVMSIQHSECVGNIHQSHSFVRGNWGNSERSSSMLLQKSCHDMDILQWLVGKKCKKASSFGSRTYFTIDNAPKDAPEYCIEGCPHADTCYYNAIKIYYDTEEQLIKDVSTGKVNATNEQVAEILKNTMWGKCVYKCDNDVVDHQVVNLEFEDGTVVDFNMCAFNHGGRFIRIMGTDGELVRGTDEGLFLYKFADGSTTKIDIDSYGNNVADGHGGGDSGIINALYDYIVKDEKSEILSEIDISVENHMIAFAAEESRLSGKIVDIDEFVRSI